MEGEAAQGRLQLVDGFGFCDRRGSLAQVKGLLLPSVMLGSVWLIDESKGFYSLLVLDRALCCGEWPTRNLSERSPFFDHLSQSCAACFQLPLEMASCIGRILRSLTLTVDSDMFGAH